MNRPVVLVAATLFLATLFTVRAQIRSGSIVGAVTDKSGSAVAAAQVKVTAEQTNQNFTTSTNESGEIDVPYLQFGRYTLQVSKEGFNAAKVTGIQEATSETILLPATLVLRPIPTRLYVTAHSLNTAIQAAT